MISLVCTFEKMIFTQAVTGYCVASFKTDDTSVPTEARSRGSFGDRKIRFTATGYGIPATDAIILEIEGKWQKTKYGVQLIIERFAEVIPPTIDGIIGYLSSGLIDGVGESTARKITDKFGIDTLNVIENSPEKLNEINGLSNKRIAKIIHSYSQNKSLRNIVSFLSPFGITLNKAIKIQEAFGEKAMEVLNERPFELCDISGFGFKTVDNIARKVKCKPNDVMRIKAAAKYILSEAGSEGHVYLEQRDLRGKCFDLLNEDIGNDIVSDKEIHEALIDAIHKNEIINNNGHIYHPYMFKCEVELAKKIVARRFINVCITGDIDMAIARSEAKNGIVLSDAQRKAVKTCFENNLSLITGGPGTGKTTVLRTIIDVYRELTKKDDILLAAPTGKAAKRMAESTGVLTAKTLHSALGLVSENYSNDVEIYDSIVIVDEMSMVDLKLAHKLFHSVPVTSIVVLVGDADQLPSVGAGNVFSDLLASECIATTVLDMVFRQSGTSRIALNAEKMRTNNTKLLYGNDFDFITTETEAETVEMVKRCYLDEVDKIGIDNVQILAPFRSRGETSVNKLNDLIRDCINPFVGDRNELYCDGKKFRLNDKIIQNKNKDGISNGDMGIIKSVFDVDEEKHAVIEFSNSMIQEYAERDFDIIDLAYAITIHKSQGSEFSTVIIPMLKSYYIMLRRNLVYTAITRAKKKVILIGEKQALMMAIHKNDSAKRNSLLGERIKQYVETLGKKGD